MPVLLSLSKEACRRVLINAAMPYYCTRPMDAVVGRQERAARMPAHRLVAVRRHFRAWLPDSASLHPAYGLSSNGYGVSSMVAAQKPFS